MNEGCSIAGVTGDVESRSNFVIMRSIIVDDEPKNVRILRGLLEEFCPSVSIAGTAYSAEEAVPLIRELKPDLLFLDIEMPFGNSFDLLDQLKPVNFEVIFITAFDEYTLRAFKYSALDYLLKPVNIDELQMAVQKAEKRVEHSQVNRQLSNLFYNIHKPGPGMQRIGMPDKNGTIVFVELKDICYIEAKKGYSLITTVQGEIYMSNRSIKEYEEILPSDIFFRVHNSSVINVNKIRKYHKGRGGMVEMDDGTTLEVASRRKEEFLGKFRIE